jgi:hypothetical protein
MELKIEKTETIDFDTFKEYMKYEPKHVLMTIPNITPLPYLIVNKDTTEMKIKIRLSRLTTMNIVEITESIIGVIKESIDSNGLVERNLFEVICKEIYKYICTTVNTNDTKLLIPIYMTLFYGLSGLKNKNIVNDKNEEIPFGRFVVITMGKIYCDLLSDNNIKKHMALCFDVDTEWDKHNAYKEETKNFMACVCQLYLNNFVRSSDNIIKLPEQRILIILKDFVTKFDKCYALLREEVDKEDIEDDTTITILARSCEYYISTICDILEMVKKSLGKEPKEEILQLVTTNIIPNIDEEYLRVRINNIINI